MRKTTRRVVALAATGAVALGTAGFAGTAIASTGQSDASAPVATGGPGGYGPGGHGEGMGPGGHGEGMGHEGHGEGMGPGSGMGPGHGAGDHRGMGPGHDDRPFATDEPAGTLTEEQEVTLAAMAEEEKLAGDLYQAFADEYAEPVFERTAASEQRHLDAVRTVLDRYGLEDPTADLAAGEFTTPELQERYDGLLNEGMADLDAALRVGVKVEETDIADLEEAQSGLEAADVQRVYEHLLAASRQHLEAFTTWSARGS